MHNFAAENSTPTTSELLTAAARDLLGRVDELAVRAADETRASEGSYLELVESEDLLQGCRQTMAVLLGQLAGTGEDNQHILEEIGRRRARQGVGMDAMLRSFRIDFRIVGELMITWLDTRPPEIRQQWNVFVLPLWQAIDEISARVSHAYREAETEMVGERERDLRALFDELLHGTGPMSAVVRRAASRFGLGEHGRYVTVRADAMADDQPPDRALRQAGMRSVWLLDGDLHTGIVALENRTDSRLSGCLSQALHARVGISPPYHALEDTRRQIWLADAARDASPPGTARVIAAAQDIPSVFVGGTPEITRYLATELATALRPARTSERARLLQTLRVHLDGDGSPAQTARTLYRHRNTVLNHLRRFEELTGWDLSRPRDVATAVLALRAAHRLGLDRQDRRAGNGSP